MRLHVEAQAAGPYRFRLFARNGSGGIMVPHVYDQEEASA